MKKEIIAAAFLLVILVGSLINIKAVSAITDELILMVEDAGREATKGNWNTSAEYAESALQLWKDKRAYTHFILPHNRIDDAESTMYELLSEIYAQDTGKTTALAQMAAAQFDGIASMELVSFGNIF